VLPIISSILNVPLFCVSCVSSPSSQRLKFREHPLFFRQTRSIRFRVGEYHEMHTHASIPPTSQQPSCVCVCVCVRVCACVCVWRVSEQNPRDGNGWTNENKVRHPPPKTATKTNAEDVRVAACFLCGEQASGRSKTTAPARFASGVFSSPERAVGSRATVVCAVSGTTTTSNYRSFGPNGTRRRIDTAPHSIVLHLVAPSCIAPGMEVSFHSIVLPVSFVRIAVVCPSVSREFCLRPSFCFRRSVSVSFAFFYVLCLFLFLFTG